MDKRKKKKIRLGGSFTIEERHRIINEYLKGGILKSELWMKYAGHSDEHGCILRWMRKLGYASGYKKEIQPKSVILYEYPPGTFLKKKKSTDPKELQKEIEQLRRELEDSKLKVEGYEIMIDIAEKEFKIPIRKKPDTK